MNQTDYRKFITNELTKLNQKIDKKIALGKSYTKEASAHAELIVMLNK